MTRADQWAAFARALVALAVIAVITVAATVEALRIGPAAAGLLYLLPVLWVSAQAGLNGGLTAALFAAFCYNFFLLEPRYTLRIHGVGDVAAFVVLVVVAAVTSRLASGLRAREIEARGYAEASNAEAAFAALLAKEYVPAALDAAALGFLIERFGTALLVRADDLAAKRTALSPLDAAAAAWALHNGGVSGQGTEIMPAADFRFVPLERGGEDVLAVTVPRRLVLQGHDDAVGFARLWTQARDRLAVAAERQAREEAEQRESVRRTLLAALGHDFRTPLTLLKSGLAELGGEAAARLGQEVDRVARLGEDLIVAARLDAGQTARIEPVDLVDIVAAVTARATGEIQLAVALPDDLPLVAGDPVMLVHLIGNLIDNAFRHATRNVTIDARVDDGRVALAIDDDGDGIDPAIAGALFDRFVTTSDRAGGSGLGLAIARDLALAMGGTLSADASPAGGARFTLRLAAHTAMAG